MPVKPKPKPKTKPKAARARVYDRSKIIPIICGRIAAGESLSSICESPGMPDMRAVTRWLMDDADAMSEYARAREAQAHVWVDKISNAASAEPERLDSGAFDPASVTHIKNTVGTMQWLAARLNPRRYGERQALEHTGANGQQLTAQAPVINLTLNTRKPESE